MTYTVLLQVKKIYWYSNVKLKHHLSNQRIYLASHFSQNQILLGIKCHSFCFLKLYKKWILNIYSYKEQNIRIKYLNAPKTIKTVSREFTRCPVFWHQVSRFLWAPRFHNLGERALEAPMAGETNKYKVVWSGGQQCQQTLDTTFENTGSGKGIKIKTWPKCS